MSRLSQESKKGDNLIQRVFPFRGFLFLKRDQNIKGKLIYGNFGGILFLKRDRGLYNIHFFDIWGNSVPETRPKYKKITFWHFGKLVPETRPKHPQNQLLWHLGTILFLKRPQNFCKINFPTLRGMLFLKRDQNISKIHFWNSGMYIRFGWGVGGSGTGWVENCY